MSIGPIHILTTKNASINLTMRDCDNRAYPRTALEQLKLQNRVHSKMRAQWLAPSRLLPIAFLLLFIYIVHLLVLQSLVSVDKLTNCYRIPGRVHQFMRFTITRERRRLLINSIIQSHFPRDSRYVSYHYTISRITLQVLKSTSFKWTLII